MADSSTIHDASTGFHDIKPPPEFAPIPWRPFVLLLACLIVAACLIRWLRSKPARSAPAARPETARERVDRELAQIRAAFANGTIDLRAATSSTSIAVRGFIEATVGIAAVDMTAREVTDALRSGPVNIVETGRIVDTSIIVETVEQFLRRADMLVFAAENSNGRGTTTDSPLDELFRLAIDALNAVDRETEATGDESTTDQEVPHGEI